VPTSLFWTLLGPCKWCSRFFWWLAAWKTSHAWGGETVRNHLSRSESDRLRLVPDGFISQVPSPSPAVFAVGIFHGPGSTYVGVRCPRAVEGAGGGTAPTPRWRPLPDFSPSGDGRKHCYLWHCTVPEVTCFLPRRTFGKARKERESSTASTNVPPRRRAKTLPWPEEPAKTWRQTKGDLQANVKGARPPP